MIVSKHVEQGSDAWLNLRKGRATASEAKKVLTAGGKISKQATSYMRKLARECLLDDPQEWTGNKYTDWGNAHEGHAREIFINATGLAVAEVGFCNRADNAPVGCSPDGLIVGSPEIETPGCYTAGLEIKCPQVDTHVGYLLDGLLPDDYKMQVHWSMATTRLRSWWFMSYFPGLNPLILEVRWDSFTDSVVKAQDEFIIQYAQERQRVLAAITLGAQPVARIEIPAEEPQDCII